MPNNVHGMFVIYKPIGIANVETRHALSLQPLKKTNQSQTFKKGFINQGKTPPEKNTGNTGACPLLPPFCPRIQGVQGACPLSIHLNLDAFVAMPNNVYGMFVIYKPIGIANVETRHALSLQPLKKTNQSQTFKKGFINQGKTPPEKKYGKYGNTGAYYY